MIKSRFLDSFMSWMAEGHVLGQLSLNSESAFIVSLEMFRDDISLAVGSGFLWRETLGIAVVTAWHNLSGLDHATRQPLHSMGAMPNRLKLRITQREPLAFQEVEVPLFLDAAETEPRWFVHAQAGSHFDIAWFGLKVDRPEVFLCANDHVTPLGKELLQPGGEVLVAGFPHGIGPFGVVPIWKRASIASNVRIPVNGLPRFLIDVAGRQGMSGAYVCGRQTPFDEYKFLGVYTGRASSPGTARESSDLGFVWWNDIVTDIVANGVFDEKPEVGKGVVRMVDSISYQSSAEPLQNSGII